MIWKTHKPTFLNSVYTMGVSIVVDVVFLKTKQKNSVPSVSLWQKFCVVFAKEIISTIFTTPYTMF